MSEEDKDVSKLVADTVEEEVSVTEKVMTFSSGVKLKVKNAPLGILMKIMARYERPEVYKVWLEQEQTWISNPDHPDYIAAVKAWEARTNEVLLDAIIILATEFESKPSDIPGQRSDKWIEVFEVLDLETYPDNASWRYLNWVLLHAIKTQEDFTLITEIAELSGVAISEEAVQKATNFPRGD